MEVWQTDQVYVEWFLQRFSTSLKPEHRSFMQFIEGKISHLEEMGQTIPKSGSEAMSAPQRTPPLTFTKSNAAPRPSSRLVEMDEEETPSVEIVSHLETEMDSLQERMTSLETAMSEILHYIRNPVTPQ